MNYVHYVGRIVLILFCKFLSEFSFDYYSNYVKFITQSTKHKGSWYSVQVVRVRSSESDAVLPFQYAYIIDIYIYRDHKILVTNIINIIRFDPHIRAIEVAVTEDVMLCHIIDLHCHGVLHLKHQGLHTYLIEKDNRVTPTFFVSSVSLNNNKLFIICNYACV